MNELRLITKSADETRELGAKIGKHSEAAMVILLDGDLGAGNTCLTQGIARGLDITRYKSYIYNSKNISWSIITKSY